MKCSGSHVYFWYPLNPFSEKAQPYYICSPTQKPSICDARTHYSKIQLLQQITATSSNNYIQFILFSQMSSSSFLRISVIVCYSPRDSVYPIISFVLRRAAEKCRTPLGSFRSQRWIIAWKTKIGKATKGKYNSLLNSHNKKFPCGMTVTA